MKMCVVLFEQGIVFNDYFDKVENLGKFGNKNVLKEKNGRIWNREWDWEDGVVGKTKNFPAGIFEIQEIKVKYEEYAIAYKGLGCKMRLVKLGQPIDLGLWR